MTGFTTDLRRAMRRLLATPLFTTFAVLSLAVGVGVTTAVYSVVDAIFLGDEGIRDPDRLALVVSPYDGRMLKGSISEPDFDDLRAAQTSFSQMSASEAFYPAVTFPQTTELVRAEAVDGAYFSTVGVAAPLGRAIQQEDDRGGARVVVLSHLVWRARFASDRAAIGRTLRIAGASFEIIGVAAPPFGGAGGRIPGTALWIPLSARSFGSTDPVTPAREQRHLLVFGRLAPSVSVARASAELHAIAARLDAAFPSARATNHSRATERPWSAKTIVAITQDDNIVRRFGFAVVALVALVLVVACTNLGNLVLARGSTRQHEISVRRALGASRWRLVREQCAESLLLGAAGAVASFITFQVLRVFMSTEFTTRLPMGGGQWTLAIAPQFNSEAVVTTAALLVLSLLVFGLEPALQLTRSRALKDELAAGPGTISAPRARRQRTLLRWQVAISAGFFIIATMFVKYTIAEARHDSGVEMDRLGVAVLNFYTQQWDEARVRRTLDRVIEEARKDPAVETVSVSAGVPFGLPNVMRLALSVPDRPGDDADFATGAVATPSIFRTLGVPILKGRGFDDRDGPGAPPVVVLSEYTARRMFGTANAVGRTLRVQRSGLPATAAIATVIGIAGDTDVHRLFDRASMFVYLPLTQRYDPLLTIAVRSTAAASVAAGAVRDALRRADPDVAVEVLGTGRTILAGPYVFLRAAGATALGLAALTLLLAMAGLFGIQSHIVAHRTREIGVRMSLGATRAQIERMVLKQGYRPVVEGLAIGLFIGCTGRAIVRAYLDVEMPLVDPWMMLIVPVPLILAAFCACYLPARRAGGVEPNVALRHL